MLGALPVDRRVLVAASILATLLGPPAVALAGQLRLPDLDDRLVDPFQAPMDRQAIVFLFTSTECPISNRYAPEVKRLFEKFAVKGVFFRLVYPNPSESNEAVRAHIEAFAYPMLALRDPRHELVKLAKATVTPEAAVFGRSGRLLYHGRIDDRYVELGLHRQAPTRADLEEALSAIVAGKPVPQPATPAVGCFLADFLR